MSTGDQTRQPSEEELRAAYEAEIKKIRVEQVLLEQVVTLVNLGRRRTGLAPGTEDEQDLDQVRLAIDSLRALLPLVEQSAPEQIGPIRDAVSQLQLAYVRIGGQERAPDEGQTRPAGQGEAEGGEPAGAGAGGAGGTGGAGGAEGPSGPPGPRPGAKPGEPGPAQRSGRLWVPGQ